MDSLSENVDRPLADFPEGICSDYFLESEADSLQIEAYAKEIDPLKEQVRAMLVDISINDHKGKLDLINVVDRLGVSHYLEEEIANQLECIFQAYTYENNYDLYTVGVHFRVFRQHGHKMSCDVFNKFKGSNGGLQENLKQDVKGILSLYEAAHLMMHGEEFLEEALDLTIDVLSSISSESNLEDQCLYNQVVHATKQPLHKGIKRVETRHFIVFYEEDESSYQKKKNEEDESRKETLLQLAKLDFNMLQLLHRQELNQIFKWCNELNAKTQLPYMRDRSLECHFWAMAIGSHACYSRARLLTAKVTQMLTIIDDTYDAYGTFEEIGLLTQAFERWDKDAIDELPVKMKWVFNFVFNLFDEFEKEMVSEERDYAAQYAKAGVLDMIRSYYTEANWAHQRYIPSYEEYMEGAARISSGSRMFITSFMLGMEASIANEKGFECIINTVPRAIRANEVIGRVMNDITSHEDEQQRGVHVASAVECYMNEHGVSEEEAVIALEKAVKDAWKDLNEELVSTPIDMSPRILELTINLATSFHHLYRETDGFTHSRKVLKSDALLVYAKAFDV